MKTLWQNTQLVNILKKGGIAVIPTDTIYGIVGRSENKSTVERIYEVRRRNPEKPCIILIQDISDLKKFSVNLTEEQKEKLKEFWAFDYAQTKSEAVSIILDCLDEKFEYLHRGSKTLAFRLPKHEGLINLLKEVGPIIAPSANPEGYPCAKDIEEAQGYFGNVSDYYLDGGFLEGKPSKVIRLYSDGTTSVIRG